ncbi:MAG: hypothetical protein II396_00390, partial [Methanobrevibacter sp.]|nr:hypothetical protein [Methanobrevibacter sp.]
MGGTDILLQIMVQFLITVIVTPMLPCHGCFHLKVFGDRQGIGDIRFETALHLLYAKMQAEAVALANICYRQHCRIGPQLVFIRPVCHLERDVRREQSLANLVVADHLLLKGEPVGSVVGKDVQLPHKTVIALDVVRPRTVIGDLCERGELPFFAWLVKNPDMSVEKAAAVCLFEAVVVGGPCGGVKLFGEFFRLCQGGVADEAALDVEFFRVMIADIQREHPLVRLVNV